MPDFACNGSARPAGTIFSVACSMPPPTTNIGQTMNTWSNMILFIWLGKTTFAGIVQSAICDCVLIPPAALMTFCWQRLLLLSLAAAPYSPLHQIRRLNYSGQSSNSPETGQEPSNWLKRPIQHWRKRFAGASSIGFVYRFRRRCILRFTMLAPRHSFP